MRKKITSLLFSLLIISIYGQTNPGGLIQNSVNSVAPKSPDAAALFRYTETLVSLYTGVPNISIPIYTIREGDIEVPISISYHAGGIKVTDEASSVGLGWSLNAGGRVSHIVSGINDFSLYGYYQIYPRNAIGYLGTPLCLPLPWNPSTYTSAIYTNSFTPTISRDFMYVGYDFQPDLFLINLPGKSYKAYLDMAKTTKPNGPKKFAIAEQPNIDFKLIDEPGAGYNFGVTDENGLKYSFDKAEITTNMTGWNTINGLSRILSRIEDTKGNIVDFYTSNVNNNYRLTGCKNSRTFYTDPNNWYQPSSVRGLTDCSKQQTGESYLERIEFTNGKIEFDWTTREDINNSKKLSSIKIYNKYKLIKQYDFTYDYFTTTDNLDTSDIVTWLGATNNKIFTHRLRLLNVTESVTNEKYSFEYNSTYNLPNKLSFSSDFWGYYNGQNNSDTFIPDPEKYIKGQTIFNVNSFNKDLTGYWYKTDGPPNTFDPNNGNLQIYKNYSPNQIHYLSDRRTSLYSLAGMLTAINYPTGGKTEYDYEPNTFSNFPMQSLVNDNTRKEASANHLINNINGTLVHTENPTEFNIIGTNIRVNVFAHFGFYFTSTSDQIKNSYWVYIKNKATGEIVKKIYNPNVGSYNTTNLIDNVILQTGDYELGTAYNNNFTAGNILVSGGSNASSNSSVVKYVNEKSIIDGVEYNYSSGGGVRIKSVTSIEKAGAVPIVKNYIYDDIIDNGTKVTSNGNLSQFPKFFEIESRCYSYDNFGVGELYTSNPGCFMNLNTPQSPNTYPFKISVYEGASSLGNSTLPQGNHVGYTKVIEQVTGKGRTESYFTNDYTTSCLMMTQKGSSLVVGDGDLIKQISYDNNSKIIKEISLKYKNNYSDNLNTYFISGSILEPLTNYGFGFNGNTPNPMPGLIHNYSINLYKSLLDYTTTKEYFPAGSTAYLETKNYNTYNNKYLVSKQSTLLPDSSTSETNYKYAAEVNDINLLAANMVTIPLETEVIENGKIQSKTKIVYSKNAVTSNKVLPTSVLSYNQIDLNDVANTNPTPATEVTYDQYDANGNLQEYTTKAGVTTAIVWGYNDTKPIAKIEGASYSQLGSTANEIISYSNYDANPPIGKTAQKTEAELLTKLNAFRTNPLLSIYKISTYSYDPLIGVRSMTPPSGITQYYKYDTTNRLEMIVDVNGNILKEFKYNYQHDPSLIFYNEEKSKTFTRTNCISGSQPGTYNYVVAASTYSSTISKLDADQKALDDIAINGQNVTNQNASCTSITTCPFTFSTFIGTPMYSYGNTTVVNSNVQFDLKFGAPQTNGQSWTSGITIGKIGVSCIPSVTRNFDYNELEGNRKWHVRIDTSGNCTMTLFSGTVNTNANLVFWFTYQK